MAASMRYQRILLKLSGEVLMGEQDFGWDPLTLHRLAQDIRDVTLLGCQLCLVIGGGNIFRGSSKVAKGIERATADYMGMLATIMNALALQSALEKIKVPARVVSAIEMDAVCESYARRRALAYLNTGNVIIFAAGTGNPFFTTDTAAALRASEMGCDVLLKGTKVDGVYSADPFQDQKAIFYSCLSYQQVLQENFRIMDTAAISLARDNHIPILVFSIQKPGELKRVLLGEGTFTIISNESSREN